jgi:superfamily II DNA or RNA helicase
MSASLSSSSSSSAVSTGAVATTTTTTTTTAGGVTIRDDQLRYVSLLNKHGGQIFADDVGFGKTLASIHALVTWLREDASRRALVVTPLSLVDNYQNEMKKYGVSPALTKRIHLVHYDAIAAAVTRNARNTKKAKKAATAASSSVAAASSPDAAEELAPSASKAAKTDRECALEMVAKLQEVLDDIVDVEWSKYRWSLLIDEAHKYRNHKSARGITLRALASMCERSIALTATPCVNDVGDICNLIAIVRRELDVIPPDVMRLWCKDNLSLALELCRDWVSFSQLDEREFPRVEHEYVSLEMDEAEYARYMELEAQQKAAFTTKGRKNQKRKLLLMNGSDDDENIENEEDVGSAAFYIGMRQHVNTGAKDAFGEKMKLKWVKDRLKKKGLKGGVPTTVIVSAFIGAGIDDLEKELKADFPTLRVARITGKENKDKRDAAVQAHNNGKLDVLFISEEAGGVGLNLLEAEVSIEYDASWNEANSVQKRGRVKRRGARVQLIKSYTLIVDKPVAAMLRGGDDKPSVDRYMVNLSLKKDGDIQAFYTPLKQAQANATTAPRMTYEELKIAVQMTANGLGERTDVGMQRGRGTPKFDGRDPYPHIKDFNKDRKALINKFDAHPTSWFDRLRMPDDEYKIMQRAVKAATRQPLMKRKGDYEAAYRYKMDYLRRITHQSQEFREYHHAQVQAYEEKTVRADRALALFSHFPIVSGKDGSKWELPRPLSVSRPDLIVYGTLKCIDVGSNTEIQVGHKASLHHGYSSSGGWNPDRDREKWFLTVKRENTWSVEVDLQLSDLVLRASRILLRPGTKLKMQDKEYEVVSLATDDTLTVRCVGGGSRICTMRFNHSINDGWGQWQTTNNSSLILTDTELFRFPYWNLARLSDKYEDDNEKEDNEEMADEEDNDEDDDAFADCLM